MSGKHVQAQRPRLRSALWILGTVLVSVAAGAALAGVLSSTWVRTGAAGVGAATVPTIAAVWILRRGCGTVTAADRVTLVRVMLTGVLSAGLVLVVAGDLAPRSWLLVALAAAALTLDAVDGWVARRTHTATPRGATLDTETDAALLLVLSGLAAHSLGWWVLAIGLMRYAFLAVSWVSPRLRLPLQHSRSRRAVGAAQGIAMIAVLVPAAPLTVARTIAVVALVLLALSFARDLIGLLRRSSAVLRPVSAEWLGQRRRADFRAREQADELIGALNAHIGSVAAAEDVVTVIDVGAGTGSNFAWLAPRLARAQRWILLDHDPQVLSAVDHPEDLVGVKETSRVVGTALGLPALSHQLAADSSLQIITCSALLDVLSPADAQALAETVCGPDSAPGTAALFSLSVTGEVDFSPPHRHDETIAASFNAHQRRAGLLGPDAVAAIVAMLQQRGGRTALRSTDWHLNHAEADLVKRYVTERAEAAVEHEQALCGTAEAWVADRLRQLAAGQLRVRVQHSDVLCLPAGSPVNLP